MELKIYFRAMIVRIVELAIQPDKLVESKRLLEEVAPKVRSMRGCSFLEILHDIHNKSRITTYSYWDSEEDLNHYRNTETFVNFWRALKPHFKTQARAWSSASLMKFDEEN